MSKILGPFLEKLPENNRFERIWSLAKVEFKKRYYNDTLGIVWALLNPIFKVLVFYFIFTYIFHRIIEGIPNFALFLFAGIITWSAFTETSRKCMKVLVSKSYLIESIQLKKNRPLSFGNLLFCFRVSI